MKHVAVQELRYIGSNITFQITGKRKMLRNGFLSLTSLSNNELLTEVSFNSLNKKDFKEVLIAFFVIVLLRQGLTPWPKLTKNSYVTQRSPCLKPSKLKPHRRKPSSTLCPGFIFISHCGWCFCGLENAMEETENEELESLIVWPVKGHKLFFVTWCFQRSC